MKTNNCYLKNCSANAVYVNREQYLGIKGLRRAKESYEPIKMLKTILFTRN